jgi:hypothetical protein
MTIHRCKIICTENLHNDQTTKIKVIDKTEKIIIRKAVSKIYLLSQTLFNIHIKLSIK